MPFDQIEYQGAGLIAPYSYHPEAPMTGRVLFNALRGAYFFSRMHARNVGQQTYRLWNADAQVYDAIDSIISSGSVIQIARFRRRIPAHITHVGAAIWFKVFGSEVAFGRHNIAVNDGTNTDTGVSVDTEIGLEPTPGAGSAEFDASAVFFDPGAVGVAQAFCFVELASVTQPSGCTITVSGCAIDDTPAALEYQPLFISAWMWSEG